VDPKTENVYFTDPNTGNILVTNSSGGSVKTLFKSNPELDNYVIINDMVLDYVSGLVIFFHY